MEILIGRKEGKDCLLIAAEGKTAEMGSGVPGSVSRCKPKEDTAHCKLTVGDDGSMLIENLNPNNKTYVDNLPLTRKAVTTESRVALGADKYALDLQELLRVANGLRKPVCDLRPMEEVYRSYEQHLERISQMKQRKKKLRMVPMALTALLGVVSGLMMTSGNKLGTYITLPVAVITLFIWVILLTHKDTSEADKKQAKDWLIDHYVCPNTGKFLGDKPFKQVRQDTKCPHCKHERKY